MWIEQSRVTFNQIKQVISSNFQARSMILTGGLLPALLNSTIC